VIRVVVFDFDGTLVDSNLIKREGFFRIAALYPEGAAAMASAIETAGDRRSVLSAFADCMAAAGIRLNLDELVARYTADVDSAVIEAPEMTGASDLLVNLRRAGLRLHISSATPVVSLRVILNARGWGNIFTGVHGAPNNKSDNLLIICESERVMAEEIVVVGDGNDDAQAAGFFGTHFIAVGSGSYVAANPDVRTLLLREVAANLLAKRI